MAMFFGSVGTLFASGTTGTIDGTVTDQAGNGVAGVSVIAVSPTGNFKGVTDSKGFYSFAGVSPDTFVVTFAKSGFEQQVFTGINVIQDQESKVDAKLSKSLSTIARINARGPGGAYQPNNTQDQYTIGPDEIEVVQGRDKNTSESNLLASLPGASFDSSGYPVLRGGRENEEGYQFEGISITDSYSNQFQNSLSVNGIQSFQLIPGAGNASVGNAGTGSVNYTAKRGAYPGFGSFEGESQSNVFAHQFSFDYGFATPNGAISNYFSFIGQRDGNQVGPFGYPAVLAGQYNGGLQDEEENNVLDNFIFKFGQNKSYELQMLYQNQIDRFGFNYGGGTNGQLKYILGDPYFQGVGGNYPNYYGFLGFSNSEIASVLAPLPGEPASLAGALPQSAQYQPNELFKIQLSHNFNSSTFGRLAYYGVNAVTTFDLPDENVFGAYELQGSVAHGVTFDLTKQFNAKNLFQAGVKYQYNHPVFTINSDDDSAEVIGAAAFQDFFGIGVPAKGFEFADFLPATNADCQSIEGALGGAGCGFLSAYFPNGVKAPNYYRTSQIDRSDYAFYATDQFAASDRFKLEGGLRVDGFDTHYPQSFDDQISNVPDNASKPLIVEPRLAATLQLTRHDTLRASFGRAVQSPPLGDVARTIDRSAFDKFNNVPSFNNINYAAEDGSSLPFDPANPAATAAYICGAKHTSICANYGDQLFNEYQLVAGTPIQSVQPETFNSYDLSYEHQFPSGFGLKVTPFYTRGYNIVDRVANVIGTNPNTNAPILGPALSTNLGIEKTSGLEFLLTREAKYGFSGQLSATYLNKLSNVPPLSASEDFFPTVPTASLALGNLYRVGYLSPFQSTLDFQWKSRGGLRINPQITYNKGYPLNPGLLTATYINGVPVNIPLTDVTGPSTGKTPGAYVDPANPGSVFSPNIAATLGTPESASAGGVLSNARFFTNMTVEFSPPNSRSTFGIQIFNLFDELYGRPALNGAYQPVATGVAGPQTGQLFGYQVPYQNAVPYLAPTPANEFGTQPYSILYGNTPTTALFYYQLKL